MFEDECFIYAKFARFAFYGDISLKKDSFRNSKINFTEGFIHPNQFIDNPQITNYLFEVANSLASYRDNITQKQKERIDKEYSDNYDKYKYSDMGKKNSQDFSANFNPKGFTHSFNYICDCCNKDIFEPEGYLLRTFEILKSKGFWEKSFQELGLDTNEEGLTMRVEYFKLISSYDCPWVICDECSKMFDFNQTESKNFMVQWITSKGNYSPPKATNVRSYISEKELETIQYIILSV